MHGFVEEEKIWLAISKILRGIYFRFKVQPSRIEFNVYFCHGCSTFLTKNRAEEIKKKLYVTKL